MIMRKFLCSLVTVAVVGAAVAYAVYKIRQQKNAA